MNDECLQVKSMSTPAEMLRQLARFETCAQNIRDAMPRFENTKFSYSSILGIQHIVKSAVDGASRARWMVQFDHEIISGECLDDAENGGAQ